MGFNSGFKGLISVQWEPGSMWKDRWTEKQTHMTKPVIDFRNFVNRPIKPT